MNQEATAAEKATRETVTEVKRWTHNLLSFKTTRPANFRFTAGQYARLGLSIDGQMIWRAYSVVSAPDDDFLEYYGVIVPDGLFTGKLDLIKPGDTIWTEKQSYGFMTPDRFGDGTDLWMLATGTGIGPFISILRAPMVWKQFRRLLLVHGVRYATELSYQEELSFLKLNPPGKQDSGPCAELLTIQAVSRQKTEQTQIQREVLHGRITTLLDNGILEKHVSLPITEEASRIMLCGNPAMIEETREILHSRGLRPCRRAVPGHFVTENYW
jgi:ferredoxin--NADP+ reductase